MTNEKSTLKKAYFIKCPRCLSVTYYYRSTSEDFRCRHCGAVFTVDFDLQTVTLKPVKE